MLDAPSLHDETGAEDVRELGTVAILPANDLLLTLGVIPAGQKLAEDEFRGMDLVFSVNLNRDAVAIILYSDLEGRGRLDTDVNMLDGSAPRLRRRAYKGVAGIHNDLVEEFVESGIEGEGLEDHLTLVLIP